VALDDNEVESKIEEVLVKHRDYLISQIEHAVAIERERCLKVVQEPLTEEQCKQLDEGFGTTMPHTRVWKLAADTFASRIKG